MVDIPIPLPLGSNPGKSRAESGGRIINGCVEALADAAPARSVIRRAPGLVAFGDSGETGFRGAMLAGSALYAAFSGELGKFDDEGEWTALSDLDGTLPVSFARNNKLPTFDTIVVTEQGAFTVDATTGAASLVDADLPQPTDVCYVDGYFFFPIADGRVFSSGINATTVAALDFTRCDTQPDALMRGIVYGGRPIFWGADSGEIFYNAANATGFPFTREGVIRGPGLLGKWAITGHENGWEKGLYWIGSDCAVHVLSGYAAQRISTPDIDRSIKDVPVSERDTIRARCYVDSGHFFVEFSCAYWTHTFDVSTQQWAESKSFNQKTRRAIGHSVSAFGKWLCGDRLSGNLIESDFTSYEEIDQPLVIEVISGRCGVPKGRRMNARFDLVRGVGQTAGRDPIERDPGIEISWSDDGGNNFSNPVIRKLGRVGKRATEITLSAAVLGACNGDQGRVFKIRMSDPRDFALLSGQLEVS